ncbi:MAG: helix-turn-helix domain-containing protein [Pseudonocardia sp.]|nr:helix-turn-helix domain-containing protein [Pseudonocardia sp.]
MSRPHHVAVLALPDVIAFELGLPHRLLGSAVGPAGERLYDVRVTTLDGGPVPTTAGYSVLPGHGPEILDAADTLIIPGHSSGSQMVDGTLAPALEAVVRRAAHGRRVVSICTGAFVLAAAGLLDGRPATTHWLHTARFRALFPQVALDPDVLFVDDGDVLTSAGNAAGIDLLLHVIRRDHGAETAAAVARRSVVAPWREGGQSQFVEQPVPEPSGASTAAARSWALDHLPDPLPLDELAARCAMSVRTFTRHFRAETGLSPARWLTTRRIELARRLLETTDLPVEAIAARAGFGTTASLRQQLHAAIGMSPLAYRRSFRAPVSA